MHILFVTNFFAPDSGAAAVRLTRLAHQLQQRGHQVTVLTSLPHFPQGQVHPGYRWRWTVKENRDGVWVIQTWLYATRSPSRILQLLSQASFMLTAILRGLFISRPDVIFIEAQPIPTGTTGVLLAFIKRRPYVLNISDLWPDQLLTYGTLTENSRIYDLLRRWVDFTYRRARGIAALSPAWADRIKAYIGSRNTIHVIYNGVDLNVFRPGIDTAAFREKYGLGDKKLFIFIGTLAAQYDFKTLLSVASQLQDRQDVRFIFIGRDVRHSEAHDLLDHSTLPNIQSIDWLQRYEMPVAWNAAYLSFWAMRDNDLYSGVIPTKLLEAQATGTPVVVGVRGITADIIRQSESGIAVPPGDALGLAAAMRRLLDDADFYTHCRHAARQYAEAHYDVEQVTTHYEELLFAAAQRKDS